MGTGLVGAPGVVLQGLWDWPAWSGPLEEEVLKGLAGCHMHSEILRVLPPVW